MSELTTLLRMSWDSEISVMSQTSEWMRQRRKAADRIEELEARLAEEIKISNERGNHIEFVLLPQMSDLSARLTAMTAERDAAIPRAYTMALEEAANIADAVMKKYAKETYSDKTVKVFTSNGDTPAQSAAKTYCAGEILGAICALTPPDDLVERVLKPKETPE